MAFAEKTKVPVAQTRNEIEKLLVKYGAAGFGYGWTPDFDKVEFAWKGRHIRFLLPRKPLAQNATSQREIDQADRQRWRALLLVIKAKLEAVEMGIAVFEEEFLAFIVMQDDRTIGEHLVPRLNAGTLGVKMLTEGEK